MPWQLSHAAVNDAENSELQTDVMRFMAILAFCLVAIFAIVQSFPAPPGPTAGEVTTDPAVATAKATAPDTSGAAATRVAVPAPAPAPLRSVPAAQVPDAAQGTPASAPVRLMRATRSPPAPRQEPPVLHRASRNALASRAPVSAPDSPGPAPHAADTPAVAPAPPASAASAQPGLSLRFESDTVLRSLVARGLVNLYAIDDGAFYSMALEGGAVRFVAGQAPAQYHEMVGETVPADVMRSFASVRGSAGQIKWGVTLPPATTRQLLRFVRTNYAGSLVITSDAGLALAGA